MRKSVLAYISIILLVSCSTYNVEKEISNSVVKKYKNSAVIFRLPKSSLITKQEFEKNFTSWIEGYKKNNTLVIPGKVSDKVISYDSDSDRFYQVSDDNSFLLNKSSGSLAFFIKENVKELKNIITDNNLDSVIIYEVDSFCSSKIQYISFNSMLVILDVDGKVNYLDHQTDVYHTEEVTPFNSRIRMNLMDKVCERLIERFLKLDYIEKN